MKTTDFFKAQEAALVEPSKRDVEAMRRSLAAMIADGREPRMRLRRDLLAELPESDPEMRLTAQEEDRAARIRQDVARLDDGNWARGIYDRRLESFVGGPGLNVLNLWIAKYETLIAEETGLRETTWPAPFRYVRPPGAMIFEGRRLRRGEVVRLSRWQYEAWRDRFEWPTGTPEEVEA